MGPGVRLYQTNIQIFGYFWSPTTARVIQLTVYLDICPMMRLSELCSTLSYAAAN